MSIYQPYTYLIGWSTLDVWYYGVRYATGCQPSDLWVRYFTSSSYVKECRKMHGEPDIIQVRKTFSTAEAAIRWESRVLSKLHCASDERWLNKSNGGTNIVYTDEVRLKMSLAHVGKKRIFSEQHKVNIRVAKNARPHRWSSDQRQQMSEQRRGRTNKPPKLAQCPHCMKVVPSNTVKRWHMDNCRQITSA